MLLLNSNDTKAQQSQNLLPEKSRRPNIVYIYADDLGYAELGAYGQQKIKTPNLDRLAKEGMRFTQHYTSTPVCAPARCMLLTGRNGGRSYIRGNYELGDFADNLEGGQMPLPEGTFTIGHLMQRAGYKTGAIGKWGLGMHSNTGDPNKQGFDYFYGYLDQKQAHNYYPTHLWENGKWDKLNNPVMDVHPKPAEAAKNPNFDSYIGKDYALTKMGDKAVQFIKENKSKPFFLYLPFVAPHVSLQAPPEAVQEYIGQFKEEPYLAQNGYIPVKYPLSTYAAMITYLDKQIGRVLEVIKQQGMDENTIIMFSSDNGATFNGGVQAKFFNSVGPLRGLKMDLYEGGIREPFLARWPGKIAPGKVSDLVSVQYDMMATLADILGVKAPANDGISMLPTFLGKDQLQQKRPYIYFEYPEKGGQVAIRMGNWKGIRTNVRQDKDAPWQLYNLSTDISENQNVAAQHPDIIKQFAAIAQKEHRCPHIKEWEFIDAKFSSKAN
ncbi:N-acetylgalactosamine-6-sulfatase [Adhaeribacter aerolatus]|uniref:N-acetylgalactosamine-6-sulfatase n=2 Tax=Adhaeribacter aerolatus TaxID=670289 RepID=A0A512B5N9_9BACT|nr:N-acetylgalactosamine-6-sulfatase [Adhaeribacter aerolatus]